MFGSRALSLYNFHKLIWALMMVAADPPNTPLAGAILRTLLYADVFQFPLTESELHRFLIGYQAALDAVTRCLNASHWLAALVHCDGGYWSLHDSLVVKDQRIAREQASLTLWPIAVNYGQILAKLPYVRMVAITGSLAMHNVHTAADDIDYLLVTSPSRVWLARLMAIAVVRLARQRGVNLCPNYVLSTSALAQDRRDLYTAHEMAQMIPLAGFEFYRAFRAANEWTAAFLPNATQPFYSEADRQPRRLNRGMQRIGEVLLNNPIGSALERWEQRRKQQKFAGDAQLPHAAAQLDADRVKGHFKDYGYLTLQRYHERLKAFGLDP